MTSKSVIFPATNRGAPHTDGTTRFTRRSSFIIPERFKDGDDAFDDVSAPKTKKGHFVNQSFVSMIANVGSNATFNPSFDVPSYTETRLLETQQFSEDKERSDGQTAHHDDKRNLSSPGKESLSSKDRDGIQESTSSLKKSHIRRKSRVLMDDALSTSQLLPPKSPTDSAAALHGQDPENTIAHTRTDIEDDEKGLDAVRTPTDRNRTQTTDESIRSKQLDKTDDVVLKNKLAEVFGLEKTEAILSDYRCGLLQDMLLQGHMYVTRKYLCFYAYLPRNPHRISKSGFLYKKGRQNPNTRRFWFILKGHILSYHANAADLYFVNGTIDLRSVISIEREKILADAKEHSFSISTANRVYHLKAESATSADEWVKHLQRGVFRLRHDRDSIKILLPIENILDIENNPVLNFTDTLRIRIVDNDETFAIEEYFFFFFNHGVEALGTIQPLVEGNAVNKEHAKQSASSQSDNDNSEDQTHQKPFALRRGDTNESILQTISQSVMIDTGPSPRNVKSRAHTRDRKHGHFEDEMRDEPTKRFEIDDEGTSQSSQSCSDEDEFDNAQMNASQILQSSGVFRRPAMIPSLRGQRTSSDLQSSNSNKEFISHEDTQLEESSDDFAARHSVPTSEEQQSPFESDTQNKLDTTHQMQPSSSSSTLQDLMRKGAYPLQKATGIAGLLSTQSKRVSDLLALESKGYYEKVTGMWTSKKTHYDDKEGIASDDIKESKKVDDGDRFRAHFSLPETEKLQAAYHAWLTRTIPVYGKLYIGHNYLCFRGLFMGQRTKMILPFRDIENVDNENGYRLGYSGLVIVVRGHEELFFEFARADARSDCYNTLLRACDHVADSYRSQGLSQLEKSVADLAKAERDSLEQARQNSPREREELVRPGSADSSSPILFDGPFASMIDFKPPESLKIICLTIGSRGDVQPYIALCKGLLQEGHHPRIVTHAEFEPWIRGHGIDFAPVAGEPAEIMRLCVEHDMFTVSFLREATSKFRGWIDQLLRSAWKACQGAEILIESPSAMAGVHIAEALQIPYFRAFTMPWTRTRAYPHAFAVPTHKLGGNYNSFSYVLFENVFWQAIAGQINRWRRSTLGLPSTSLDLLQASKIPFLYNFSPSVVIPPLDFNQWIRVTGYWFLDEGDGYDPPTELVSFIQKARRDGKKIVYVGFGSIVVENPAALTKTVVDSVLKADVRCVLSKGWSERLEDTKNAFKPEFPLPNEIFQIRSAPHDWLFGQIDAAAHHGGAGTTGASLRAGIPTVVKPFFGDQFFFGSRVEDLGVGRCLKKINTSVFARTLWEVTNNQRIINKARRLGERIRKENGVSTAIEAIYRDLEYARSLIKNHKGKETGSGGEDIAKDWTLIDDESEADERAS